MTDEDRRAAYADAFAAQGRSDWEVYKYLSALTQPSFPRCHALHYLQMATEKIAKAYRIRDTKADIDELARHHTGFEEFVNSFFRSSAIRAEFEKKEAALKTLQANATKLAREIEKLAPAIAQASAPENAEYPWERDGRVFRPCTHEYSSLSVLGQASGRATMNIIERAFRDFEKLHIS